jgi:hypothetical protein
VTAKTTVKDLRNQISVLEDRQLKLGAERDELAFASIVERNGQATKRLNEITAEFVTIANEIATLNAAIAEAGRRADAAAKAASAEAERKRAEQAEPIAKRMAERGAKLDAAIKEYCEHYAAIQADIDELARLGVPIPSRAIVQVNLRRSHEAHTASIDKVARAVPPHGRHTFDKLTQGWAVPALNWIASKLNSKNAAKAA